MKPTRLPPLETLIRDYTDLGCVAPVARKYGVARGPVIRLLRTVGLAKPVRRRRVLTRRKPFRQDKGAET